MTTAKQKFYFLTETNSKCESNSKDEPAKFIVPFSAKYYLLVVELPSFHLQKVSRSWWEI